MLFKAKRSLAKNCRHASKLIETHFFCQTRTFLTKEKTRVFRIQTRFEPEIANEIERRTLLPVSLPFGFFVRTFHFLNLQIATHQNRL